ncbi:MAG: DUF2076 family protein [Herminiimonas sp.]|nr:DUF2076 family protein [Herminiimonas sp.]
MTPQETEALRGFLAQLTQVQAVSKDPQAASMIAAAFSQQPDAGYLLVQRAMLLDQALAAARAQIAGLQQQLDAEQRQARASTAGGGFLDPASAWGRSAGDPGGAMGMAAASWRPQGDAIPGTAPRTDQRFEPAPQYVPPAAAPARPGLFGGGGGFLGNMAATAAGVAGGAFLFQGIENLMGHRSGGAGFLGDHAAASPASGSTVNNFYGAEPDGGASRDAARLDSGTNSSLEAGLDNGIEDLAGGDDTGSQDDMSST